MGKLLKCGAPLLCLALILMLPSVAKAAPILDFGCGQFGGFNCTGTVTNLGGGNVSGSGIGVFNSTFAGDQFTLSFDTTSGIVTLMDEDTVFAGTIVPGSVSVGSQSVVFSVNWVGGSPLPSAVLTINTFSTPGSMGNVFNASVLTNGVPGIPGQTIPEPASLFLMGSGLLGFGSWARKFVV